MAKVIRRVTWSVILLLAASAVVVATAPATSRSTAKTRPAVWHIVALGDSEYHR